MDSSREVEAQILAEIGRRLFEQRLRVTVELPAALAAAALTAWQREDVGDIALDESAVANRIRHEAGELALIGLAVEERSSAGDGDRVLVELDAWQIGSALDAAEERGMLSRLPPPDPQA